MIRAVLHMEVILVQVAFSSHENEMWDALALDILPPRSHDTYEESLDNHSATVLHFSMSHGYGINGVIDNIYIT